MRSANILRFSRVSGAERSYLLSIVGDNNRRLSLLGVQGAHIGAVQGEHGRGRLDASRIQSLANTRRDLFEAMKQIAETRHGPEEQMLSMGCSIKWNH
jgi:hypothetical protein